MLVYCLTNVQFFGARALFFPLGMPSERGFFIRWCFLYFLAFNVCDIYKKPLVTTKRASTILRHVHVISRGPRVLKPTSRRKLHVTYHGSGHCGKLAWYACLRHVCRCMSLVQQVRFGAKIDASHRHEL